MGADQNRIILPPPIAAGEAENPFSNADPDRNSVRPAPEASVYGSSRAPDRAAAVCPLESESTICSSFPIVRPSPALPAHGQFLPARKFHTMRQKIPDTLSRLSFHRRQRNQAQSRSGFSASEYFLSSARRPATDRRRRSLKALK